MNETSHRAGVEPTSRHGRSISPTTTYRPLTGRTAPFSTEQAFIMPSARVANSPYKARNKGTSDHNLMQQKDLAQGKGMGGAGVKG